LPEKYLQQQSQEGDQHNFEALLDHMLPGSELVGLSTTAHRSVRRHKSNYCCDALSDMARRHT